MAANQSLNEEVSKGEKNKVALATTTVDNRIDYGTYTVKNHDGKGRFGRVILDVFDENHKRLVNYFKCKVCNKVIYQDVSNKGTKPLNRHADKCDPPLSSKELNSII